MPTHYTYTAAFPFQLTDKSGTNHVFTGLNIREYYAAMAMQGLCAFHGTAGINCGVGDVAERAVQMADALIAQLAKPVQS